MQQKKSTSKKSAGDTAPASRSERINIMMDSDLRARVLAAADREKRNFSNMLAVMAEDWLAADEEQA